MITGLWTAQLEAGGKSGAGVAVFVGGKVLGGDSGFFWNGAYQEQGETFKAQVHVKNFVPNIQSIIPILEYDLVIEGKIQGDKITATGTSASFPVKLNMTLVKRVGP